LSLPELLPLDAAPPTPGISGARPTDGAGVAAAGAGLAVAVGLVVAAGLVDAEGLAAVG